MKKTSSLVKASLAPLLADSASRAVYPMFALVANGIYPDSIITYISVSFGFVPVCASIIALGIMPQILPQLSTDHEKGLEISFVAVVASLVAASLLATLLATLWLITADPEYLRFILVLGVGFLDCLYWVGIFVSMRSASLNSIAWICCLRCLPLVFLIPFIRGSNFANTLLTLSLLLSLVVAPVASILTRCELRKRFQSYFSRLPIISSFYLVDRLRLNIGFLCSATVLPLAVSLSRQVASERLDVNIFVSVQSISSLFYPFLALSSALPLVLTRLFHKTSLGMVRAFQVVLLVSTIAAFLSYFLANIFTLGSPLYSSLPVRGNMVALCAISVWCANLYPVFSYFLFMRGWVRQITLCLSCSALISYLMFIALFSAFPEGMQMQLLAYYSLCLISMLFVSVFKYYSPRHRQ